MANAHAHGGTIKDPGTYDAKGIRSICVVFALVGIGVFVAGLMVDPTRTWASFVLNHFYFMSLALGGIFFAVIQWLTGAMWSAPIRRIMEAIASYLPFSLITMAILYFGLTHLYSWSHPHVVQSDLVLQGRSGYMNPVFFMIRNLAGIAILALFTIKFIGNSLAQDTRRGAYILTKKNRALAPAFLILLGLLYTMMSWDQMMSLDPHWYSTMFGVYCFAGLFYAVLALITLLTLHLQSQGKLEGIVNDNHLHDMGKYMFAFTVFWAYIGFSQFMLIWYANLPEETVYFLARLHSSWFWISCFLVFGKFFLVFFLLLPRDAKRNHSLLRFVAVFMLVAQWIDMMWVVQPEFFADGPHFGWVEAGVTLGYLGVFGFFVFQFLARNTIVAIGDPRLEESVFHHHQ